MLIRRIISIVILAGLLGALALVLIVKTNYKAPELPLYSVRSTTKYQKAELSKKPYMGPVVKTDLLGSGIGLPDIDVQDSLFRLVNRQNPMEEEDVPALETLEDGFQLDYRAAEPLMNFINDARALGYRCYLTSAYRSREEQGEMFNDKVDELCENGLEKGQANDEAKKYIAYPGQSEHELGLAVDIAPQEFVDDFRDTKATVLYEWLLKNCAIYGFIPRYQEGKEDITGMELKRVHFRYVGQEAAKYIVNNELCLEEFLELYRIEEPPKEENEAQETAIASPSPSPKPQEENEDDEDEDGAEDEDKETEPEASDDQGQSGDGDEAPEDIPDDAPGARQPESHGKAGQFNEE